MAGNDAKAIASGCAKKAGGCLLKVLALVIIIAIVAVVLTWLGQQPDVAGKLGKAIGLAKAFLLLCWNILGYLIENILGLDLPGEPNPDKWLDQIAQLFGEASSLFP